MYENQSIEVCDTVALIPSQHNIHTKNIINFQQESFRRRVEDYIRLYASPRR